MNYARLALHAAEQEMLARQRIGYLNTLKGADDSQRAFIRSARSRAFSRLNTARAAKRHALNALFS